MKLDKLELLALLGIQARNRELVFMMEQVKTNIEQLTVDAEDLFCDIEMRLKMAPGSLTTYDVDTVTGEILTRKHELASPNAVAISPTSSQDTTEIIADLESID